MADNVSVGNTPGTADYVVASEQLAGGEQLQSVELYTEAGGVKTKLAPLTDAQLRASAVPVSGPLSDTQLRASAVPVSGPVTDGQLRATAVPVSGPLTDGQLRASAVPVSQAPVPLTASPPNAASVGVASAEAVPVNASRKGLVLVNLSDNTISIAFGVPAVLNAGITLLAQGGSWTMTRETFTTAQVRAIAAGAASPLAFQEFS